MTPEEVKQVLENTIDNSQADVKFDGNHAFVNVVSPAFSGLNAVKKQQLVYGALQEYISSGAIHAVHMKTYTPEEWEAQS